MKPFAKPNVSSSKTSRLSEYRVLQWIFVATLASILTLEGVQMSMLQMPTPDLPAPAPGNNSTTIILIVQDTEILERFHLGNSTTIEISDEISVTLDSGSGSSGND